MHFVGSKKRYSKIINEIVNKYFSDCKYYCEPFAGGLNIAQRLDKKFEKYYFNDNNLDLVNLYRAIRDDDNFEDKLEEFKEKHSEEFYYKMREEYNRTRDPVILFYLIHTSFRSNYRINLKTNNFNVSYGFGKNFKYENLDSLKKVLSKSICSYRDWKIFIANQLSYSSKYTLFVCDPPYKGANNYYTTYSHHFLDENKLLDFCKRVNSILFNFENINITRFDKIIWLENKHLLGKSLNRERKNTKDLKELICIHKEK